MDNLGSEVASEDAGIILNSFTVDVEDYFQTEAMASAIPKEQWSCMPSCVVQNTERIFELLASRGVRGTFFFLGWVAERFPDLVRQAASLGHELGCHSYWHRLVYQINTDEFREDTKRAKGVIEDAAGIPVLGYRAPSFSMVKDTEWAQNILAELGFKYDSSICPVNHDLYNNPDAPRVPHRIAGGALAEFPLATISIGKRNFPVGGGGYLRLLPYTYTRLGLSHLNNRERFRAILYVHPWEIDPAQPRIATCVRSRLRQYTGLKSTVGKIERLFEGFRFAPIIETFAREIGNNLNENTDQYKSLLDRRVLDQHPSTELLKMSIPE